ncbi:MAG: carbohydrate porin [Proteobacteria bacterium]|nr:carbohydrate porin [Pseudomonadota bacterium]
MHSACAAERRVRGLSQQNQWFLQVGVFRYVGILSAFVLMLPAYAGESAIQLGATNTSDLFANIGGGLARRARLLDSADVTASYAPDDGPLDGWSAFAAIQFNAGGDFSGTMVGDLQGVSSIDQVPGIRVVGAWVGRSFEGVGAIKAGIIDLNTEFDVPQTGALFLNSSQGIGIDFAQSGVNGPSTTPDTGIGIVGNWLAGSHWELKAGLFEGTPGDPGHPSRTSITLSGSEGVLAVAEIANRFAPHSTVRAGGWIYSAGFETLDGHESHGNAGAYASIDARLIGVEGNDEQGLSAWVRLGAANARINPVRLYFGAGAVYTGIFGDLDRAGLAVAAARLGDHGRAALGLSSGETDIEATYSAVITDWLSVQPDVQYVVSPGADPSLENAFVIGTRFTLIWN